MQAAYHGTPHRFDTFSTDKIGTGEGAQAHGWGLYFAENKDVSEAYREGLLRGRPIKIITENGKPIDEDLVWGIFNTTSDSIKDKVKESIDHYKRNMEYMKELLENNKIIVDKIN